MAQTLTSTVPGAITQLFAYMQQVAADNPSLEIGTYLGTPIGTALTANYLILGEDETGQLLTGYRQEWAGLPAAANRSSEEYGVPCCLRAYAGNSDPAARLVDSFTMFDGLMGYLQDDPGASGALTPSGSWKVSNLDMPSSGPFGGKGWGVLMTFTVSIINVRLTS
jgi:hypothetical protein